MKKRFYMVSFILFVCMVLSACSGNQEVQTDAASDNTSKGKAEIGNQVSNEPVELVVTSRAGLVEEDFENLYAKYLREEFPHYTYQFIQQRGQDINTVELVLAGQQIDLMFESHFSSIEGVIDPGLGFDISPLIKEADIDLDRFEPVTLEAMRTMTGGDLYGLPNSMEVVVTFYNKDLFDKFGVNYPTDGMTWDEQLALGTQMSRTEDGVQYLGLLPSTGHVLKLNPFNLPFVDVETNKSTLGDPNWNVVLSTILGGISSQPGFIDAVKNNNSKLPGRNEFIQDQNIAMYTFFTQTVFNDGMDTFNWDMVSAPTYAHLPGIGHQNYTNFIYISSTSDYKKEAMNVIKYLTSDEFQMNLSKDGTISPLRSEKIQKSLGANYPIEANWGAVFYNEFAEIPVKGPYESIAEKELAKYTVPIIIKEIDINTALRQAEEEANAVVSAALSSK